MTVMTDSNMCFSMKVDMPTTWQNWSKSSMKLYEIDRHYPTSSHKHTGECLHIFGKHIFLASGASGWSAPPVASRKSRMKASGCSWIASRFCMNASMLGTYVYNGCIIIINNHNMIIWIIWIIWFYVAGLHTVITVLMLLCINWRIAKQSIDVYSIFLAGCSCIKSLHASDSCSSSTEVHWRVCQVSRFQRSAQSMV